METPAMNGELETVDLPGGEAGFPYRIDPEGDGVRVTVQLPGVNEEKIWLDLERKNLVITVANRARRRWVRIPLPFEARFGDKKFSGGVLEISLQRRNR
jgi:HSP20 family molecular chaperone IbpA